MVKTKTDPRLIFLRARLDEREVAATLAVETQKIMTRYDDERVTTDNTWRWGLLSESVVDGRRGGGYSSMYLDGAPTPEEVLADVDSKRRLIDLAVRTNETDRGLSFDPGITAIPQWVGDDILAELLRPFQADPAFDKEWLT